MFKNILIIIIGGAILVAAFWFAMNYNAKTPVFTIQEEAGSVSDSPVLGGDKDENGCIGSAGYSWCQAKEKCLRTWEESCPVE